jgi:hypothetical protein
MAVFSGVQVFLVSMIVGVVLGEEDWLVSCCAGPPPTTGVEDEQPLLKDGTGLQRPCSRTLDGDSPPTLFLGRPPRSCASPSPFCATGAGFHSLW